MTPQERIKTDAEAATNDHAAVLKANEMEYAAMIMRLFGYKEGYIAGATGVHDRAQVLVDALEKINTQHRGSPSKGEMLIIAHEALEQWKSGKGKEAERPCPHCGKELSRDRDLCCRECGKEVGDE